MKHVFATDDRRIQRSIGGLKYEGNCLESLMTGIRAAVWKLLVPYDEKKVERRT